ncbi:MAG: hypothetical protein JRF15_16575 [Deltaproteobacteria bacterium]|jgi:thiamine pyrophosphate-dependent acetolactate synthase large subunit-like protein|nr:hypothetical protein [Deltaproteobacteria bacterium]
MGLELALAQPQREVLAISGDGALSRNLGRLVTVIDSGATNPSIALLDNGIYDVTGGQTVAARGGFALAPPRPTQERMRRLGEALGVRR